MSIFDQIIDIVNGEVSISLFFMMKNEHEEESIIKFANIAEENDRVNTTTDLLNVYKDLINNRFSDLEDSSIMELSSADDRRDAIYLYDLDELPTLFSNMKSTIPLLEGEDYPIFNSHNDNFSDIKGIIIIIGDAQEKVVLYKQNYPISLLKRDKFTLTPLSHPTRLGRLTDDILKIDINFHFMLFNDEFFIFDIKKMEQLTGYDGIIKKEAIKSIDAIRNIGLLQDVQPLIDDLDDISFSRKLTKVYKDSKVIGRVPNNKIINFIKEHAYFKINPIKIDESNQKLAIDTKVSKNALIKLLNDDLLHSDLTEFEYDSVAKNDVEKVE